MTKTVTDNVYYKTAYKCNRRWANNVHLKTTDIIRCHNPEVSVKVLDPFVLKIIEDIILKPTELKKYISGQTDKILRLQKSLEKELRKIDSQEDTLMKERQKALDSYATEKINRDAYTAQCLTFDIEAGKFKYERLEISKKIPILHKKEVVHANIMIFCETAKSRLEKCKDFDSRRRFVLDFIQWVIYDNKKVTVQGKIPLQMKSRENSLNQEDEFIEFSIDKYIH